MESSCRFEQLTDSIAYFLLAAMRVAWKAKLHPIANETKMTPNKVPFIEQNELVDFFRLSISFLLYVLFKLMLRYVQYCVRITSTILNLKCLKKK